MDGIRRNEGTGRVPVKGDQGSQAGSVGRQVDRVC